ncbi:MAG: hypothetical protein ACE5HJ_05100 [Thermoplasmata archaeon]
MLSVVVVVGLILVAASANALWGRPGPTVSGQERLPPNESPFPTFNLGTTLHVVRVTQDVNYSTVLTLLSLQGLVNRDRVELYLDFQNETSDSTSMLTTISRRYGVTYDVVDVNWTLGRYLQEAKGLVAYDPRRPESINIATMYAAINGAAIVGPDTRDFYSRALGLPVLLDYSTSGWSQLDAVGAYERAFSELYPHLYDKMIAILPPERFAIRDYLIAAKVFVFYHPQGALASPRDLSATLRMLRATPRGIPIIGWFNSPTETEENLFVQMASSEGKYLVGVQVAPNLSVHTALGRNQTFTQRHYPSRPITLQNRTYAVIAVADGDNLDFVVDRMRDFWDSPVRGTFPIAWSLNPLLVDLAPPYLDYYYRTASDMDSFVASPSGAGYMYPDYLGPADLEPFLEFSTRYLEAADMDIIWLLNAFPASEIQYSSRSLSAYVEALAPRGLVLDYADQPTTRAYWMQSGGIRASPVVRSTHFWTTKENFLGKLQAAMDSWDAGPHFVWITVYPWRFDLNDAKEVVDELELRTQGEIEFVSPETFFKLMAEDFQSRAWERLQRMKADPLASFALAPFVASAEEHIDAASEEARNDDENRAAYEASLALEDLRATAMWEALLVGASISATLAGSAAVLGRRKRNPGGPVRSDVLLFLLLAATVAIFFVVLRSALNSNFWTYHFVALGIAVSGVHGTLRHYLGRTYPRSSRLIFVASFLSSSAVTLYTIAAFPLAMLTALLVMNNALSRGIPRARLLLTSLLIGAAIGFLSPVGPLALAILGALVIPAVIAGTERKTEREVHATTRGAWFVGLAVSLPLVSLATAHYYSVGLRLDLEGDSLAILGAALLVVSALTVLAIGRFTEAGRREVVNILMLTLAAFLAGLLLLAKGTLPTSAVLLGMLICLAMFAYGSLHRFLSRGGSPSSIARPALTVMSLLLIFMRVPPLTYSLLILPLPEFVEYALYAPQIILAGMAAAMIPVLVYLQRKERQISV